MPNHLSSQPRQSLSPDDLACVIEAFEAGLSVTCDATSALNPYEFRQRLARLIIERAVAGEPDSRKLKQDAIHLAEGILNGDLRGSHDL
jgi:hypothetical protein